MARWEVVLWAHLNNHSYNGSVPALDANGAPRPQGLMGECRIHLTSQVR